MKVWLKTFLALGVLFFGNPAWSEAQDIAVIVSKGWGEATSIDTNNLKQIYLGKTSSFAGKNVKPVNAAADSSSREKFEQQVLGMTPDKLKRYWIKEGLRGGARPPKSFRSSRIVIIYVAKVKGAIGYVEQKDLNSEALKKVKIIGSLK